MSRLSMAFISISLILGGFVGTEIRRAMWSRPAMGPDVNMVVHWDAGSLFEAGDRIRALYTVDAGAWRLLPYADIIFPEPRDQRQTVHFYDSHSESGYVAAEDGGWVAHGIRCEP